MITDVKTAAELFVLIADDDPMVGILAAEALQQAGFSATVVSEGSEVMPAFDRRVPDIVLLDVEMPGATGFDLCEQIRRRPDGAHLPVVMITGHDDTESVSRAYAVGATDFMAKPIGWSVLPHRINFLIRAHQTSQALRQSEQRNAALLQAFPDWVFLVAADGRVLLHLSGGTATTSGVLAGTTLENSLPPDAARRAREAMQAAAATRAERSYEFEIDTGSAKTTYETRIRLQPDSTYLFVVRDVTESRRTAARIEYLAYYDTLTGLANRQLFVRELRRAIRACQRKNSRAAVVLVDLDRFKRINDTLGHAIGDALLQSVARRLETCVRPTDVVARVSPSDEASPVRIARLAGDEFVVLLADIEGRDQIAAVAMRLRHVIAEPFSAGGHQFVVTPSVGIAIYPDDATDIEDLLIKADMAMYAAKDQGRNRHAFFESGLSSRSLDRLELEGELRRAIEARELVLHYQPKVDVVSGAIAGVEALLRWHHRQRGWISPGTFIPLAEETGLMLPLGDWVIGEACRQLREWANHGLGGLCIAVNVSTMQFSRDNFIESVLATLREHDVDPRRLEIEITASLLMRDVGEVTKSLRRLRDAGLRVSVDDFGTGYSSLGYLKQFPVDTLKIDRSFVKDLQVSSDDAAICAALIAMARELKLTTVAEGVEVVEQLEFLRRQGCNQIQGFLFSKPLPAAELEEFVRSGRRCVGFQIEACA